MNVAINALSLNQNLLPHHAAKKTFDVTLLLVVSTLLMVGLIMIASASIDVADVRNGNPFHYVIRHGLFVVLGVIAGAIVYQFPTSLWQKAGWLALSASLVMLVTVLIIGKEVNGSTRWIGLGALNMQPSELTKLLLVSYLAGYLVRRRDEVMRTWWGFAKPMLVLMVVAMLLLMEPDFGATVVIGAAFLGMIFLSGAKLGQFILLIFACLGAAWAMIQSSPYRLQRLTGYTDPWADQFGSGYQLTQSLIAFGRGDWAGVGLGNSIQKQFYLPEAHTDFVFAILAEEFGLIGTIIVVILFSVLVYRALMIGNLAERSNQLFSAYFAYGIGILLGVQAFINIGVNMGLLPTKGLTLPLVSYGGSSLIVSCMCIGVLARIYHETVTSNEVLKTEVGDDNV
ncbi:MAG: cell division protein FtsW [Oleiphilaceae bacterium]|jgi:cell division protein FtsW